MIKLISIFIALLIAQTSWAGPLPKLCSKADANMVLWCSILEQVLKVQARTSLDITYPATATSPQLRIEGSLQPNLRRDLRRNLPSPVSARSNEFSVQHIRYLIESNFLSLEETEVTDSPFRHFMLYYKGKTQGAAFALKSLESFKLTVEASAMGHTVRKLVTVNPPHSIFGCDENTLYPVRRLAHLGYLTQQKDGTYTVHQRNPNAFTFFFPPLTKREFTHQDKIHNFVNKYFNDEYAEFDRVLQIEGTSYDAVNAKIQRLYDTHFEPTLNDPNHISDLPLRMPKIHHKIWVTSKENPKELPEKYFTWWIESIPVMRFEDGWQHWLWIEDEALLPKTVKRAKDLGITIKHIWEDCPNIEPLRPAITFGLNNKWFSIPSDILRAKLVYEFGGVYLDTDYRVYRDLTPLMLQYDFCMGHEPCAAKIGSSSLIAKQGHPILNNFLNFIIHNYNPLTQASYFKETNSIYNEHMKYAIYGSMLAIAYALAKVPEDNQRKDIILPPMYLYPTHTSVYPVAINDVYIPGEIPPPHSFANHYWELSWQK